VNLRLTAFLFSVALIVVAIAELWHIGLLYVGPVSKFQNWHVVRIGNYELTLDRIDERELSVWRVERWTFDRRTGSYEPDSLVRIATYPIPE
jgi:hypothetical protein